MADDRGRLTTPVSRPKARFFAEAGWPDRIRSVFDTLVESRLTIPAIVLLMPLAIVLLYPNVLYPGRYDVDMWLYISWARDFEYLTERWYNTYYFVRFAVTVPGNVIYSAVPNQFAPYVWGFCFNTIYLASVAGILRRLFGARYGLLGLLFVASDVAMQRHMSYGYTDGPSTAYLAASLYFTVRAANETHHVDALFTGNGWISPRLVWWLASFFLAGLAFGLAFLTYFSIALWALPIAGVFLLLARRDALRVIAPGAVLVVAGALVAFLFHLAVFHHFTGRNDFWTAPLTFSRQPGSGIPLAFADFSHGYLHTASWPHLVPATIVYFLSLGVCLHALRNRVSPRDTPIVASLLLVAVGTLLFAFQVYSGTLGIASPPFFTYAYLAVGNAAIGFVAYARRYFGEGANVLTAILASGFVLWWLLRWLDGTSWVVWSELHDVSGENAGLVVLIAAATVALMLFAAGRRPRQAFSRAVIACAAVLLLLATAVRADDGWLAIKQGEFDGATQFRFATRVADQLRQRYGGDRFLFAYSAMGDGNAGSLAWAVNANFMFEYTQLTRELPKVSCPRAPNTRNYVFAGNAWVNEQSAIQPLLDCGIKAEYVDSALVADGDDYLYLAFYRQIDHGPEVASVSADKWVATNEGKLAGSVLTTDPRPYAFSAVLPLPELTGPVVLRVPIKVTAGEVGALITRPDDLGDILVEIAAGSSNTSGFIDIPLTDATKVKQIILRNRAPAGDSVADVGPVQVFRPAGESQVPARGVSFEPPVPVQSTVKRTSEGVYKLRGTGDLDLASIAIKQDAPAPAGGKFLVKATTSGFGGSVRVVDKDGKTLASEQLPQGKTSDVVELKVPALSEASSLVFSSTERGARGELRIEAVVAFSDSQR